MTVELLKANVRVRGRLSLQDMIILRHDQILENSKTLEEIGIVGGERLIVSHGERPALADSPQDVIPDPGTIIRTGLRERCKSNGISYWRNLNGGSWKLSATEAYVATSEPLYLSIAHQLQGNLRFHWSLFLARDGEPGYVYQVKGDVEAMRYQPSNGPVNLMTSHSFHTIYHIAELTESQAAITKEVCDHEIPPSAPNRRLVTENCQSWVVRVVSKLVKLGIVKEEKLEMARQLQDPIEKQ